MDDFLQEVEVPSVVALQARLFHDLDGDTVRRITRFQLRPQFRGLVSIDRGLRRGSALAGVAQTASISDQCLRLAHGFGDVETALGQILVRDGGRVDQLDPTPVSPERADLRALGECFLVRARRSIRELVGHSPSRQPLVTPGETVALVQVLGDVVFLFGPRRRRYAGDLLLEALGLGAVPDAGSRNLAVLDDHRNLYVARSVGRNVDVHQILCAVLDSAVVRPQRGQDLAKRLPFVAQHVHAETRLGINATR